ncbi:MAG: hypothetical protein K6E48_03475 [Lachnospiraceae bacterium]|nr:hypothetical protein [Lachnospiraceae bacterium]
MNETKQNKTWDLKLHNGLSSILLILVILSLISFACLSMVSATADQKLTAKLCDRTTNYYAADSLAKEKLLTINETLAKCYADAASEEEYFDTVGTGSKFYIPVSETQKLMIGLTYLYPDSDNDSVSSSEEDALPKTSDIYYEISEWRIETDTSTLEYDESLKVAP